RQRNRLQGRDRNGRTAPAPDGAAPASGGGGGETSESGFVPGALVQLAPRLRRGAFRLQGAALRLGIDAPGRLVSIPVCVGREAFSVCHRYLGSSAARPAHYGGPLSRGRSERTCLDWKRADLPREGREVRGSDHRRASRGALPGRSKAGGGGPRAWHGGAFDQQAAAGQAISPERAHDAAQ